MNIVSFMTCFYVYSVLRVKSEVKYLNAKLAVASLLAVLFRAGMLCQGWSCAVRVQCSTCNKDI